MRYLFLAAALILGSSATALACIGTVEYPAAVRALENNPHLSAEHKAALMAELKAGMAVHDEGHATKNMSLMGQSLQTLQTLKPKISE